MLTRNLRDDLHSAAHGSSTLDNYWRNHFSHMLEFIINYHNKNMEDNDMVTCEKLNAYVVIAGCDDKSNMQVGNEIPLSVNPRQSN